MLAQFPIARAFGVDACGAVLCSGDRAPRHHQAATRLVARSIGRCTDGRGGFAQGGKQQPAAGRGGVGLPAGRGPDHDAVGQLLIEPAAEGLEQVVVATGQKTL